MKIKYIISCFSLFTILLSCGRDRPCFDLSISPVFIGFDSADIDTLILRKFKSADNYQSLIDTFIVTNNYPSTYSTSHDSTTVQIDFDNQKKDIRVGYDWQLFIPSKNRTIFISDIISEKKSQHIGLTIGRPDYCYNTIFSAKLNNQFINLKDSVPYVLFIHN